MAITALNSLLSICGKEAYCASLTAMRQVLRGYAALFAFIIVLTETEVERILAAFAIFESWLARSLFQFFVAVLTLYTTRMKDEGEGETDFQKSLQL